MRLATWNCARGPWPAKRAAAEALQADILVLTEVPRTARLDGLHWFGNHLGQNGITVLTAPGYTAEPLAPADVPPCVVPFRVHGPTSFTLLAVWTWPEPPFKNYKAPLLAGLGAYRALPGPFVIAGDFNGNTSFDRPGSRLKWSECFRVVEEFGVVSAYHAAAGEPYGHESQPTQYQTRKTHKPFHLDYVFIPSDWRGALRRVRIPGFEEYALSDHRPVVVDLDFIAG
jgi:hypothetical protein